MNKFLRDKNSPTKGHKYRQRPTGDTKRAFSYFVMSCHIGK